MIQNQKTQIRMCCMSVLNRTYDDFVNRFRGQIIYNHIQNDFIQKSATNRYFNHNNISIRNFGEVLHCATYAVPLLGALIPKVGIPLRLVTDLSEFAAIGKQQWPESLIKSAFSGVSAYCIFFAPLYCKHVEVVRSLVMHVRDITSDESRMSDRKGKPQPAFHLLVDLFNVLVLKVGGLELQLASHTFQLFAGLLDCNEESKKESYLGIVIHLILTQLRFNSLIATRQALYQPKQLRL
jgi:hypothetical protein